MMKTILFLWASAVLYSGPTLAAQTSTPVKPHYFFCSLNYMFSKFPNPLDTRISAASLAPGVTHIAVHADALGYYRPLGPRAIVGGVFEFGVDRYSAYGNRIQVEHYQPSLSGFYFLDEQVGSGLFVRADIGPALLRIVSGDAGTEKSPIGWGSLCGAGMALPAGSASLTVSINYSYKNFNGDAYEFISTGIGILF